MPKLNMLHLTAVSEMPVEIRIIHIYRYFSLLLTSIFYLTGEGSSSIVYKLAVVVCLTVSSVILNYFYIKYVYLKNVVKILVIIETISNVIILIPTGGLNSPYIWYSLTTVLVTVCLLDLFYFWFTMLAYIAVSTTISYLIFDKGKISYMSFLKNGSNLMLSYILIISAIKMLMTLTKKLEHESQVLSSTNKELIQANKMIEESIDHIASLYQSIYGFVNIKNKNKLLHLIAKYTENITHTDFAFVCVLTEGYKYNIETNKDVSEECKMPLLNAMEQKWGDIIANDVPSRVLAAGREFEVLPIKSSYEVYGILGIEKNECDTDLIKRENTNQIKFLSSLSAIIFERFKIEDMNRHMLVAEEQNRIANEIHDSVCQRLFYVSCKVQSLIASYDKKKEYEFISEMSLIKDSLISTMKELREEIYKLSSQKNGQGSFEEKIRHYIEETSRLNEVSISFNKTGSMEIINFNLKSAIYRIICEGIGNAIRHGKGKNLCISMNIENKYVRLDIEDDGMGFDLNRKMLAREMGLGIRNLYNLVYSFNGDITIDSQINKGTLISITMPNISFAEMSQGEII